MNEPGRESEGSAVKRFGKFFRGYGIGISLVVSALPLATLLWNLLPMFDGIKPLLTAIASGGSFLLVGIIFAQRHAIAKLFFPGLHVAGRRRVAYSSELEAAKFFSLIPMTLGVVAVLCLAAYFIAFSYGVQRVAYLYSVLQTDPSKRAVDACESLPAGGPSLALNVLIPDFDIASGSRTIITCWIGKGSNVVTPGSLRAAYAIQFGNEEAIQSIRKRAPSSSVPYQVVMGLLFFFAFVCAASAFILTGLKDFLQGEIGLSDRELMLQQTVPSRRERFDIEGAPGLYGIVEYSPDVPELEPIVSEPLCVFDNLPPLPEPTSIDPATGVIGKWRHIKKVDKGLQTFDCNLTVPLTVSRLEELCRDTAAKIVTKGQHRRVSQGEV